MVSRITLHVDYSEHVSKTRAGARPKRRPPCVVLRWVVGLLCQGVSPGAAGLRENHDVCRELSDG
jgi:hypothetical protein